MVGWQMKILFLIIAVTSLTAQPVIRTVCASGCAHTTFQAAVTAAACGDIIELRSGETFSYASFLGKQCPSSNMLQVRPSLHRWLPLSGVRITRSHPALAIVSSDGAVTSASIYLNGRSGVMSAVDTGTNIITVTEGSGWVADEPVLCGGNHPSVALPGGMSTFGGRYYIRAPSGSTFQLSLTPGGSAIDLTSAGTAGDATFSRRPVCVSENTVPRGISIRGIEFQSAESATALPSDIQAGEYTVGTLMPSNLHLQHIVTGTSSSTRLRPSQIGINLSAYGVVIRDSWIGFHYGYAGAETKGIALQRGGNVTIENNYISAAGINVLAGGSFWRPFGEVEIDGLELRKNRIAKAGHMQVYRVAATDATGACYFAEGTGAYWLNTTSGDRWRCNSGATWTADNTLPTLAADSSAKNLVELKRCIHCSIIGNQMVGSFASTAAGQGMGVSVINLSSADNSTVQDVLVENNWLDYVYGGIYMSVAGPQPTIQPARVYVHNNLVTRLAATGSTNFYPPTRNGSSSNSYAFRGTTGIVALGATNNTFRGTDSMVTSGLGTVYAGPTGLPTSTSSSRFESNILVGGLYPFSWELVGGIDTTCTGATTQLTAGSLWTRMTMSAAAGTPVATCGSVLSSINNTAPAFVGADGSTTLEDHRQASTSPFSAACSSGCAFTAADGGDVGVDIPRLRAALDNLQIRVSSQASGSVEIRYREVSAAACTARIHPNRARLTDDASITDGGAPGERAATFSSITAGRREWSLTCGSRTYAGSVTVR